MDSLQAKSYLDHFILLRSSGVLRIRNACQLKGNMSYIQSHNAEPSPKCSYNANSIASLHLVLVTKMSPQGCIVLTFIISKNPPFGVDNHVLNTGLEPRNCKRYFLYS